MLLRIHQGTQQREEILKILEAMEGEPDETPQVPGLEDFYLSKSWLQCASDRYSATHAH